MVQSIVTIMAPKGPNKSQSGLDESFRPLVLVGTLDIIGPRCERAFGLDLARFRAEGGVNMAEVNVEETVKRIVEERLSKSADEVTLEAKFIDDLGADSLDQTELLMALEEEFNVDIDDEANSIETVGDAVSYISTKLEGANS